jgi:hypothetical protein
VKNPSPIYPCTIEIRFILGLLFLGLAIASAVEPKISEIHLEADGQTRITVATDASSYYVLYRGEVVTNIRQASQVGLGVDGSLQLTDALTPTSATARFYRVKQVQLTAPQDTDGDGIDDVYELKHSSALNPLKFADASAPSGNGQTWIERYRSETLGVTTLVETSPRVGEEGVSVTRETFVRFSAPLSADTQLGREDFFAEFGGRRILSRIHLSSDRRTLTLFYLENLPAGARIHAIFRGDHLKDEQGRPIDADGDGQPGGSHFIDFDTVSVTPVANTAVVGKVYRSDIAPDPLNITNVVERPLKGVLIEVVGAEETLRTETDSQGRFMLSPSPVGRFFVRIDGRPSTSFLPGDTALPWAKRAYYPLVEKAWEAVAGRTNNLAGAPLSTNGIIYLPMVAADTLQAVSSTRETVITFPASVLTANPALAGVEIRVPPNSLVAENGARGGMVGIAPVAANRLPEPLPPGLKHTLDISIQTDGPQNFDQPVPVRFPNLPDPETGLKLPPGAKSALWSFNHDSGRWEIAGPMTVTADGNYVESDPGYGVKRPGWHGTMPGTEPSQAKPSKPCQVDSVNCTVTSILSAGDCITSLIPLENLPRAVACGTAVLLSAPYDTGSCAAGDRTDCLLAVLSSTGNLLACVAKAAPIVGTVITCTGDTVAILKNCTCLGRNSQSTSRDHASIHSLTDSAERLNAHLEFLVAYRQFLTVLSGSSYWTDLTPPPDSQREQLTKDYAEFFSYLVSSMSPSSESGKLISIAEKEKLLSSPLALRVEKQRLEELVEYLNRTIDLWSQGVQRHTEANRNDFIDVDALQQSASLLRASLQKLVDGGVDEIDLPKLAEDIRRHLVDTYADPTEASVASELSFRIVDKMTGIALYGKTSNGGGVGIPALRPNALYRAEFTNPRTLEYGQVEFRSADSGRVTILPEFLFFEAQGLTDRDNDGLPDIIEPVLGTDPNVADSDGDGIPDGIEIHQGTNPLDGRAAAIGVFNSASTEGNSVDLAVLDDLALVANSDGGLALFSLKGNFPLRLSYIKMPGPALRVANAGRFATVACGSAGLAILDLGEPGVARIRKTILFGSSVDAVAVSGAIAYAGCRDGQIAGVDLATGTVIEMVETGGSPILDLSFVGDYLYALSTSALLAIPQDGGELHVTGSAPCVGGIRLSAGEGLAYVTYSNGVNVYTLAHPGEPEFLLQNNTAQRGWLQIVPNGSGIGLACMGVNGPDDVSLYTLGIDGKALTFQTTFATPGIANALSIYNGLAYVADGSSGLSLLNYLPYDSKKQPPKINLRASFPLDPAIVEENKVVRLSADVTDDVQVRNVEFYVDGAKVTTDGNFPFEHRILTPSRSATKQTFTIRAKATDTGGNATWTDELRVLIAPDATPPLVRTQPGNNSLVRPLDTISVHFSETINLATLDPNSIQITYGGTDSRFGTGDDVLLHPVVNYHESLNSAILSFPSNLAYGVYRGFVSSNVTDLAGLRMADNKVWTFWVSQGGLDEDDDGDSISNAVEIRGGTNPFLMDSDGDGWTDEVELADGFDPIDSTSHPTMLVLSDPPAVVTLPDSSFGAQAGVFVAEPPILVELPSADIGTEFGLVLGQPQIEVTVPPSNGAVEFGIILALPPVEVLLPDSNGVAESGLVLAQPVVEVGLFNGDGDPNTGLTIADPAIDVFFDSNTALSDAPFILAQPPLSLKIISNGAALLKNREPSSALTNTNIKTPTFRSPQ